MWRVWVRRGGVEGLGGETEAKRQMWIPRSRWVSVRKEVQVAGCKCVDWIGLDQDRDRWRTVVSAVTNFRVP